MLALFAFGVAFFLGTHPRVFNDGDVSWHIAAGRWMLEHGRIPHTDPFSYTAFGKPWIAHEWLSEIVLALAYNRLGYAGPALLVAAAVGVTLLIIGLRLRRWMRPAETCAALMVVSLALMPLMLARPLVLTWPLLAWWVEELLRARERNGLPRRYLIPLMTLWVNLHASFAVGLGLLGFFALDALVASADRRRTFIRWALFCSAAGVAALINPNGLTNVLLPLGVFSSPTVGLIGEFQPTAPALFPAFEFAVILFLGIALWRGARVAPVRLLLILVLFHLALAHIRHQSIWLIVTALVALPALTTAWIAGKEPKPPFLHDLRRRKGATAALAAAGAALFVLVSWARLAIPIAPEESGVNAAHAFASIPPSLRGEPVLNEYSMGGPLILRGIKVAMDGRTDLYGDAHFLAYRDVYDGNPKAFAEAARKWKFCWAIFPLSAKNIVALLDASPGWERIHTDKFAVIHVKRPCGAFRATPGTGS